jgi:hypothetical protein
MTSTELAARLEALTPEQREEGARRLRAVVDHLVAREAAWNALQAELDAAGPDPD